jgi:prolyl oligopeptidase
MLRIASLAILCGLMLTLTTLADGPRGKADGLSGTLKYPVTKRIDHTDEYHGTKVADPYRWLEEDVRTSKDVADWVTEQNKVTFGFLKSIPEREAIKKRLTDLWNYEKYSAPSKIAGRYYVFSKNDGLQNQSVLYIQETLDSKPEVLLDPNQWSKDGTVALAGTAFTDDGKYMAYGVSEAGSDWMVWRVLDVAKRKPLDDEVRWVKYSGASWTADGKGYFYSRFAEPKKGEKFQALTLNQKMYYHRLGTPQAEDVLVYERPDQPKWGVTGFVTDDGRYLVIYLSDGTTSRKNRVLYKDLQEPYGLPVPLIDDFDSVNSFIDNDGPRFYFKTDRGAPRGRVAAIDLRRPAAKDWKEIIPQEGGTLQGVNLVGNLLVASYLKDAKTQVKVYAPDGRFVREVELPGIGTAGGFGGRGPTPRRSTPSPASPRRRASTATTPSPARAASSARRR